MTKTFIRAGLASALLATVASPALAADVGTTTQVNASITSNCHVSASSVEFGNVDPTLGAGDAAPATLSVTCTNGTAWAASADAGNGSGASLAVRKMNDAATGLLSLNYSLFTDEAHSVLWGNGTTGATISDTGSGVEQTKSFYGQLSGGQFSLPAGDYSDIVAITVTY